MNALPIYAEDRAVLIGVSQYDNPRLSYQGYDHIKKSLNLMGIEHDLISMKEVTRILGYSTDQVEVLFNQTANARAIRDALKNLQKQTQAGDQIVIYFSLHGSQLQDLDTNDSEKDGKDEVLFPSDVRVQKVVHNRPVLTNVISDDEIFVYLSALPGRNITLIMDSCHAGSMYRGENIYQYSSEWLEKGVLIEGLFESFQELTGWSFSKEKLDRKELIQIPGVNLLYLSASDDSEITYASESGSKFTRVLASSIYAASVAGTLRYNDLFNGISHTVKYQNSVSENKLPAPLMKLTSPELGENQYTLTLGQYAASYNALVNTMESIPALQAISIDRFNSGLMNELSFIINTDTQLKCYQGRIYALNEYGQLKLFDEFLCQSLVFNRIPSGRNNFYSIDMPILPNAYIVITSSDKHRYRVWDELLTKEPDNQKLREFIAKDQCNLNKTNCSEIAWYQFQPSTPLGSTNR